MVLLTTYDLRLTTVFAAEDPTALEAAFLRGEYEVVVQGTKDRLRRDGAHEDEFLYLQGASALKLRDWELARGSLERLVQEFPRSRWRPQALLVLGQVWEEVGREEKALEAYQGVLEDAAAKEFHAQAGFQTAAIHRRQGRWRQAQGTLESVIAKAPESAQAGQAREILRAGDFYFTVQVGAFADPTNARKLAAELKRLGYATEISRMTAQGRLLHRVRIGRFEARQEAEDLVKELQREGFPGRVFP